MKIQELIRKYEELWEAHSPFHEPVPYTSMVKLFLKELKQLDEPQKVKVPQFVADWYEKHKDNLEYDIWEYIFNWNKQQNSEFHEWMNHANYKPLQTLVNMHQFGYEVEKEPKYAVKIKNTNCSTTSLVFSTLMGEWFFSVTIYQGVRFKHTRKELEEANFGWVFDCPGIEIEEVE